MVNKKIIVVLIVLLVVASALYYSFGLTSMSPPKSANQEPVELRVFVAASLINVVENASETFEKENNCKILFNSGGSDKLYQQISSGFPADVYMAADSKWTKKLKDDGLLYNSEYWNFTTNKLIVILPADNPKNINGLSELTEPGIRIVVADWSTPVGSYTNQTLTKIESTWGNTESIKYKGVEWENFRDKTIRNIISYEPSIDYVVSKVKLGYCDAGFTYISDVAVQGSSLKYIQIPDDVNTIGTYGIATLKDSKHPDLATRYVEFWLSNDGQQLLKDLGFGADLAGSTS